MATNTCTVSGQIVLPDDTDVTGGRLVFTLSGYDVDVDETVAEAVVVTDIGGDGSVSVELWPNHRGVRASYYAVKIVRQTSAGDVAFELGRIQVPDQPTANIASLLGTPLVTETVNWTTLTEAERLEILAAAERDYYTRDTLTELEAVNAPSENDVGYVLDDGGNTGTYEYDGADWNLVAALPTSLANITDFDTPLSTKLDEEEAAVPAKTSEVIIRTKDGYAILRREDNDLLLGNSRIEIDGGFFAMAVKTADGYMPLAVADDGTVYYAGMVAEVDPFRAHELRTADGYSLFGFDPLTGGARLVLSPDRFELCGRASQVSGVFAPGAVSNVRSSGDYFAYDVSGAEYSGKVIGRNLGDFASPHIADGPVYDVIEANGQSWQTMLDYAPADIDVEDATGETSTAVRLAISPMVAGLRNAAELDPVDDGDVTPQLASITNAELPGDLWRVDPSIQFGTAQMAAIARARFQKRFGLTASPAIVLQAGWPGTSSEKFLPEGSSYSYTDDDGNPQTQDAVVHPTSGEYLWAGDIDRRQALADLIRNKWFSRPLRYEFLTWLQGPFTDYGQADGFMEEFRAQQDALVIPGQTGTRHILWDQNAGKTDRTVQLNGVMAQLEFPQANASGQDWLVGPRYPYWLKDTIHHSAFGTLQYAELTGQAMAYIQMYGEWEPLWITGVTFDGADVTITTNRPRQTSGDLIAETDTITAADNHGFTLWDDDTDTEITISNVVLSGTTITLTASASLSGNIEVAYAWRGPGTRTAGTEATPNHSATWGNVKMAGRDAPAIIPTSVMPTLDQWLCAFKKVYSV